MSLSKEQVREALKKIADEDEKHRIAIAKLEKEAKSVRAQCPHEWTEWKHGYDFHYRDCHVCGASECD